MNKPPPIAEKIKHTSQLHGITLEDNYAWMRDYGWPDSMTDPKVLKYLNDENAYANCFFDENAELKEKIFQELKGRIKLSDQSTYIKKDHYYYYSRTEEDKDYPIYCRKSGNLDAPEEVILDANKIAEGKEFAKIGALSVSPDHRYLAYSIDFSGNEKHLIKVIDLELGKYLPDEITNTAGDIVWHSALPAFFYTPVSDDHRTNQVFLHRLGNTVDQLVLHEQNPLYEVSISKTSSLQYLVIEVSGHDNNECYVLNIEQSSLASAFLITPRRDNIRYNVEHHGEFFYIITNDKGANFRLARTRLDATEHENWQNYIDLDDSKYLKSFYITKNYLVLNYKENGLAQIVVRDIARDNDQIISFPEEAYSAAGYSTNFYENDLRISYSSLGRPSTTYTYDFISDQLSILKTEEIPSGFDPNEYKVERIFANNDGVKVPISLFYKKSLFKGDGSNPLYLYGYGSYGIGIPPSFKNAAVTLADRGFVYAIAHIRGGDDLGFGWYEAAKFLTKKRTFEDFIAATEHLIKERYTSAGNIVIFGGSAGGLLVGAVINERPDLYRAAIAAVPFVDVLNTMLDESLPLTPGEFKEWGNPKELEYFEYMRSYSPYDNVKAQNYPHLFVTSGIADYRVGYWEPAKWVAKLREMKRDDNMILFKTNMSSGHRGASGRFDYLKEDAEDYVFIFKLWGLA